MYAVTWSRTVTPTSSQLSWSNVITIYGLVHLVLSFLVLNIMIWLYRWVQVEHNCNTIQTVTTDKIKMWGNGSLHSWDFKSFSWLRLFRLNRFWVESSKRHSSVTLNFFINIMSSTNQKMSVKLGLISWKNYFLKFELFTFCTLTIIWPQVSIWFLSICNRLKIYVKGTYGFVLGKKPISNYLWLIIIFLWRLTSGLMLKR